MSEGKIGVLGQVLLYGGGGLLVLLWLLNAALISGERHKAEEQRRATSRTAAMHGGVTSSFRGGSTEGSAMLVQDIYAATKWPLVAMTLIGGLLTFRYGVSAQRLAEMKAYWASQRGAMVYGVLLLPGIGLLLFAAVWFLSDEAAINNARVNDRVDLQARTQTGIPYRGGGTMSVTFGQPSNEARVSETKRDEDLPKIFVVAVSGGSLLLMGLIASALRWWRMRRVPMAG